jgi:hypothetical protein
MIRVIATSHRIEPLSPRGRGMRRLSERSELSRSWVRGLRRRRTARERYDDKLATASWALLRARAPIGALPLIQLRLNSLCSLSLRNLLPQGEKVDIGEA